MEDSCAASEESGLDSAPLGQSRSEIIGDLLNQALQQQESGNLVAAEDLHRQILAISPEHADSLNLLGVIAYQRGKNNDAVELIREAIAINSQAEIYYCNLGSALQALNKLDDAATAFQQALSLKPDFADAAYNLGNALMGAGKMEEAAAFYIRAISLQPRHADAYCNLGNILQLRNRFHEAAQCYTHALALKPELAPAQVNLGLALQAQDRLDEAAVCYKRALALQPGSADVCFNLGKVRQLQGRMKEAIGYYNQAIALGLDHTELHFNLGSALQTLGRLDEAVASYQRSLKLSPDYVEAHGNLGSVFFSLNRLEEAVTCHVRALELNPAFAEEHYNLGNALRELERLDEAIAAYERALKLSPDNAQMLYNLGYTFQCKGEQELAVSYYRKALAIEPTLAQACLSEALVQLLKGDFAGGWKSYESRWRTHDSKAAMRSYAQPLWHGESLGPGRLLIWGEQGVGDEIMFAGLIPDVLRTGTRCILECDKRLQPLFARSFSDVKVIAGHASVQAPEIEFSAHLPCGNLAGIFRSSEAAFNMTTSPYLVADPAVSQHLRANYHDGRRLVGLAWNTKNLKTGRRRSIDLQLLAPLFARRDLRWINLQYGDPDELEAQAASANEPILLDRSVDQFASIDRFAAQIAALDLVITIDNSTAHLAGALGVPVCLLLPFSPDWRWMLERDHSPWYPSVRLFRQPKVGDWSAVIERLHEAL